jgi:hypothetical protein
MGYIQSGASNDLVVVDRTPAAMRANLRPNEIVGSYRTSLVSSAITFSSITASNGVLFTFKNTGSNLCLIRSVQIGVQIITTGFTTTARQGFSLYRVPTSFTQGTTGGTGYGAGQGNSLVAKKRTSMPTSAASMVIYASGAGITGDTASTEDTSPYAQVALGGPAGVITVFPHYGFVGSAGSNGLPFPNNGLSGGGLRDFFQPYVPPYGGMDYGINLSTYPLVLSGSEGFRIKNDNAFIGGTTGAGTAALVVSVDWDEASTY